MSLSFFKLHLASSSCLVIDRSRESNRDLCQSAELQEEHARTLLDPNCGAGGRVLVYLDDQWPSRARAFKADGRETADCEDAWLCAARLYMDSGRARSRSVILSCPDRERRYEALASGTLATSLEASVATGAPLDGDENQAPEVSDSDRARGVLSFSISGSGDSLGVIVSPPRGPSPRALARSTVCGMDSKQDLVWVQVLGRELIRFLSPSKISRLEAAGAAARAAHHAALVSDSLVAEWMGPCRAVRYATLEADQSRDLVTRGRFWARIEDGDSVFVAGSPEYAFEGTYDKD